MSTQTTCIKKAIEYMEQHLEDNIHLDDIANSIGYSKFYLNRIFAAHTGMTIHKYLQSRRLTSAAEKLAYSKKPIVQIAQEAGYDSQQAFSFAFKQAYQYPPSMYRKLGSFTPKQGKILMRGSAMVFRAAFSIRRKELAA